LKILYIIFLWFSLCAAAYDIDRDKAIAAIIGEAADQGEVGMTAVAEAIRNRGTLQGVYGLRRTAFIASQPPWVHKQAAKAWDQSAKSNLVNGATHWESIDFKTPVWAYKMTVTARIGKHIFYKKNNH
jgi:spore germination cell wall hydrolase CwlJ-like protein